MSQTVQIEGVTLHLAHADQVEMKWIGNEAVREQLEAAWLVLGEQDVAMNPRLIGKPGVGKTTLAYSVARDAGHDVYIMQCTMDTRPEDLIVTPVIADQGHISYHASPLVTAMVRGGTCVLDEGNRMSEKSWASLAPLLDQRRYVESIIAGIKIKAHPDFRVCVTMNDDASTYELPEYIQSRLQPQIEVAFPSRDEEMEILRFNVPFADAELLQYVTDFLQKAHSVDLPFTSRDGVNIVRFSMKLAKGKGNKPVEHLPGSIEAILGQEGMDFLNTGVPSKRSERLYDEDDDDEEFMSEDEIEDLFNEESDDEDDDGPR